MKSSSASQNVDIVGVGVSVWDVTLVVDTIPKAESVVQAKRRHVGCGGGIAVAMATAAKLGCRAAFLDSLGSDPISESMIRALSDAGVNVQHLQVSPESTASVASILVNEQSGERSIIFAPGHVTDLQWTSDMESLVAGAKALHLNGRHLDVCRQAIAVARRHNVCVSYDGGAHRYRNEIIPLLEHVDILIVAEHFARCHHQSVSGGPSLRPPELASFLQSDLGCELVGVTMGVQGSHFCDGKQNIWHQPAHPARQVVDTTGCGDVFHGAFLSRLVRGDSYPSCAEFASMIASKNAESYGALAWDAD